MTVYSDVYIDDRCTVVININMCTVYKTIRKQTKVQTVSATFELCTYKTLTTLMELSCPHARCKIINEYIQLLRVCVFHSGIAVSINIVV